MESVFGFDLENFFDKKFENLSKNYIICIEKCKKMWVSETFGFWIRPKTHKLVAKSGPKQQFLNPQINILFLNYVTYFLSLK